MLTPEQFRERLLDFIFDLLPEPDTSAVRAYLDAHPEANVEVDRARDLLSKAAKSDFSQITFAAPKEEEGTPTATIGAAASRRPIQRPTRSMAGVMIRWVVAASVLFVVAAAAFPAFQHVVGYWRVKQRAESAQLTLRDQQALYDRIRSDQRDRLAAASQQKDQIKQDLIRLETDRVKKLREAEEEERNKQLVMRVTGPAAIQSGAPNEFTVDTRYLDNRPAITRLSIRLVDQNHQTLHQEKEVTSLGRHPFVLPADLPIKPETTVSIEVSAEDTAGKGRSVLKEEIKWSAPRYVTHLATDKPMYQPGQNIFFRSLTLNRLTMQPPAEDFLVEFSILSPRGQKIWSMMGETRLRMTVDSSSRVVLGPDQKPIHGVGAGEFHLPETMDGGEYTLVVRELNNRFPEEKRKFLVNKYKPDRLNKELDFHRKSYGPGDEVIANCKVSRAEGGPLVGREPSAVQAVVDNQVISAQALGRTDANGWVRVRCVLPTQMERGIGTLTVKFTDGGAVESIQKPIPIALNKLFLEFYPEGGHIVAGAPNRVYFQVRNTLDKPAEMKGRILDDAGKVVASAETLHDDVEPGVNQGMGVFAFTPQKNGKYKLVIDEPAGISGSHPLPAVQDDGVTLAVPTGVTGGNDPIRVEVHSPGKERQLLVGAYCRGRTLASARVQAGPAQPAKVDLKPESTLGGVVRITVFEEQPGDGPRKLLTPRAERLVFRKSDRKLNFQIQPDKSRYAPGDPAKVTLSATNEKGAATAAVVMVAVVNQSIITMADEKVYRSMPTHMWLTGEVRRGDELEHADFLLGEHPAAAPALDLLLGVQGWRRFVEQNPRQAPDGADEVERLLVLTGQASTREVHTANYKQQEIESTFAPKRKDLRDRLEAAILAEQEIQQDPTVPQQLAQQQNAIDQARRNYAEAAALLTPFEETHRTMRLSLIPILGVVCVAVVIAGVIAASVRGLKRSAVYVIPGAAVAAGCILLMVVLAGSETDRESLPTAMSRESPANAPNMNMPDFAPGAAEGGLEMARDDQAKPQRGGIDPRAPRVAAAPDLMVRPKAMAMPDLPGAPPAMKLDAAKADPERKKPNADRFAPRGPGVAGDGKLAEDLRGGFEEAPRGLDEKRIEARRAAGLQPQDFAGDALDKATRGEQNRRTVADQKFHEELRAVQREAAKQLATELPREASGARIAAGGGPAAAAPAIPRPDFAPPVATAQPFLVREFAHVGQRVAADVREDRTETVYWHPVLVVDDDSKSEISFQLSDEVTRFRILVAGHTLDGRIGSVTHEIEVRKPFSLEAKLPNEVTAGDKIDLPVVIANDTDSPRSVNVVIEPKNFELSSGAADRYSLLKPQERTRRIFRLHSTIVEGDAELRIVGTSEPFASDGVLRRIPVVPEGYPVRRAISDLLENRVEHEIELPADFVNGTLRLRAQIYPSTLADLQKGLESLLREPNGCFEQTSTTNYPNTLILSYLKESDQANPQAERRARELLARGYERLVSFECEKPGGKGREGYEWFGGQAPPHEALTAYGLLQFKDMAGVSEVDQEMVQRTRNYLLSRRKGDGTFLRNARALDSFGRAPQHITDAYVCWALTETGKDDLTKEIDRLLADHGSSSDPYFLSLLANALLNCEGAERRAKALELLKKAQTKQADDGGLDGAQTSITSSGGRDLRIETTALAVLGWLKANSPADFALSIDKASKWITQQRGGYGGFGSTQSTILALKALIGHARANKKPAESGDLRLFINGQLVEARLFDAGEQGEVFIDVHDPIGRGFKPGKNKVELRLNTKRAYPYTLAWQYQTLTPLSNDQCQVRLSTKLDKTKVKEGDGVRLNVTLENIGGAGKGQPMTVAIIGLPAGLKVPEDMKQLKDYALLRRSGPNGELESGPISFFELRGRELVLYWRDLKPEAKIELAVDLIAEIPGEYRGPASRAYLYYNADHKFWVKPLQIAIEAAQAVAE